MKFEYDPCKSKSNLAKHGIDFEELQQLWEREIVSFETKPGTDVQRELCIGTINGKHWTAIITRRKRAIRIISGRRSRKEEVERYEEAIQRPRDRS